MRRVFLLLLSTIILSCFWNLEKKDTQKPGVYVDEERLIKNYETWLEAGYDNYCYDFIINYSPSAGFKRTIISVVITNGDMSYDILEYLDRSKPKNYDKEWSDYIKPIIDDIKDGYLKIKISDLYDKVFEQIEEYRNKLNQNPKNFYSQIDIFYSEDFSYIRKLSNFSYDLRYKNKINGGTGSIEISNFAMLKNE